MLFVSEWLKGVNAFPRGSPRTRFKASLGVNRALWSLLSQPVERVDFVKCVEQLHQHLCTQFALLWAVRRGNASLMCIPQFPQTFPPLPQKTCCFFLPPRTPPLPWNTVSLYFKARLVLLTATLTWQTRRDSSFATLLLWWREYACSLGCSGGGKRFPPKYVIASPLEEPQGRRGKSWDREKGRDGGVETVLWGRGWRWAQFKVQSLRMWMWVESKPGWEGLWCRLHWELGCCVCWSKWALAGWQSLRTCVWPREAAAELGLLEKTGRALQSALPSCAGGRVGMQNYMN